jgi:hypothetical protein
MLMMLLMCGTFKTSQKKGGICCLYCWCCPLLNLVMLVLIVTELFILFTMLVMVIMMLMLVMLVMLFMVVMIELLALVVLFWYCDAVGGLIDAVFVGDSGLKCYNVFIIPGSYGGVAGDVWCCVVVRLAMLVLIVMMLVMLAMLAMFISLCWW